MVGWVEVTKPFDYAVPALRRPSGAAKSKGRASPTAQRFVLGFALAQPNLQLLITLLDILRCDRHCF